MHPKFAERIATMVHAKKKAEGPEAVRLWWSRFGALPQEQFDQLMAAVMRLRNKK
jgi:hypothetical protein